MQIEHNGQILQVDKTGEHQYTVHLGNKTVRIHRRQDNEGANHWFVDGTDHETEESKAIGIAIEAKNSF